MKRLLLLYLLALPLCLTAQSCNPSDELLTEDVDNGNAGHENTDNENTDNDNENNETPMNRTVVISIANLRYTATLEDNPAAAAFAAMLPLTAHMTELNGNEKYYNLDRNLPTDAHRPGTIHAGDLLLWGSNTVVLFYETFSSSYSYTRLGKIDNPDGLAAALGNGNVTVTFSLP